MIGAGGGRKIGEELREVRVRLDAVRFCRFDERVQAGARGGAWDYPNFCVSSRLD